MTCTRLILAFTAALECTASIAQLGTEHIITDASLQLLDLRLVDIDGDGDKDLVGLHYDQFISIRENEGNGQFSNAPTYFGSAVNYLTPADLDSDGDVDLVANVGTGQAELGWYENEGQGVLAAFVQLDESTLLHQPYVTDIDDDGDVDVLGSMGSGLGVYLNNGDQSFSLTAPTIAIPESDCGAVINPLIFADVDLDGDGDRDLLAGDGTCLSTYWVENAGSGIFTAGHLISDYNNDPVARPMDLDQDGDLDVVLSDYDRVLLFENNGSGTFTQVDEISSPDNDHTADFVMFDFDNDGDFDVMKSNGANINWVERTGPMDLGDFHTGVPIPPGAVVYFELADIGWSQAPELFYSNSVNRVAYFGNEGSALGVPQNTPPSPALILSRSVNGPYLRLPGPQHRIEDASAWALSGARILLRTDLTDRSSLFLGDLTAGIYVLSVQSEEGLGHLSVILLD